MHVDVHKCLGKKIFEYFELKIHAQLYSVNLTENESYLLEEINFHGRGF